MSPSPYSLAAFAIAGAMAAVALAFALPRLRARFRATQVQRGPDAAAPARVLIAVFAAAAAGILAMGFGLYTFFADVRTPPVPAAIGIETGASRAELAWHLERSPDDGRAWALLARIDFAADRFADAAAEYERALASAKVALDAGVWCEYADALGMAQGGSLSGRPRELVMRALAQNPTHPRALEMAGSAAFEAREYAAAARYWRQLLPQLASDPRAQRELGVAIARADQMTVGTDAQSGAPAADR